MTKRYSWDYKGSIKERIVGINSYFATAYSVTPKAAALNGLEYTSASRNEYLAQIKNSLTHIKRLNEVADKFRKYL